MKKLINIQELAKVLGVSVKTVRRRIAGGKIPAIQTGGQGTALRFDLDEVMRAVKSLQVESAATDLSRESKSTRLPGPTPKWKNINS